MHITDVHYRQLVIFAMLKNILNMSAKLQSQKLTVKKSQPGAYSGLWLKIVELLLVIDSDEFCLSVQRFLMTE